MFGQKIDMKQNVQNEKLNQHYKIKLRRKVLFDSTKTNKYYIYIN